MNTKPTPVVPNSLALSQALEQSAPLSLLRERIRDSNARLMAIQDTLPPPLRSHVKAGPVDSDGWTLLAANASVAAKIRQLQPKLEATLLASGWAAIPIRIKIQSIR